MPRPTLLLDKHTNDAHDNPVMAIDKDGFIWIFSTAHGTGRPAYIHRSKKPYDIEEFERVAAVRRDGDHETPIDNFSYFQVFYDRDVGFRAIFTRYSYPAARTACFMSSADGVHWSEWQRLAAIEQGHYQIGAVGHGKIATMLNVHPNGKGLNGRTNLYYLESADNGTSWRTAAGKPVEIPLTTVKNPALVRDYQAEGLLVYIKDLQFDRDGRPVLVYSTCRGFEPGPTNGERTLCVAKWAGDEWTYHNVTSTDHNYDSASLSFDDDGTWRIIGPTDARPATIRHRRRDGHVDQLRSGCDVANGTAAYGGQPTQPELRATAGERTSGFRGAVGRRKRAGSLRSHACIFAMRRVMCFNCRRRWTVNRRSRDW